MMVEGGATEGGDRGGVSGAALLAYLQQIANRAYVVASTFTSSSQCNSLSLGRNQYSRKSARSGRSHTTCSGEEDQLGR